ncbi:hypothetical protein EYR40_006939 [Pleurotus pulmonarius]|nr:hypothetical protein EYR36_003781 [Pleurotus pulmonarius]KAF4599837.1 hypothetical protein EYR40_006939 [Pleurotus pulmonarius]
MEPESQNAMFEKSTTQSGLENVPKSLKSATMRMKFPPSYVIVGVYRLCTDKLLYKPAWDKCRHGARRGIIAGLIWAIMTYRVQKKFIELFLSNSPRIAGLSNDTIFGFKPPFSIHSYAAMLFVASQVEMILTFFLSRNMRIARDRAWAQTVESRGKGPEFWQPYVEEWSVPPRVLVDTPWSRFAKKYLGGPLAAFFVKKVLLLPFDLYPFIGIIISSWLKALSTAHVLHRRYFEAKKMTDTQVATFMQERKWDYRIFGFTAALLEGLPIIGLVFQVSNRVGAAMWAHDLEKHQHYVRGEIVKGTWVGPAARPKLE